MAAERLVFRPETFDLVSMGEAVAYVADPGDALSEAHRVLRSGGRLAVSCQRRSLNTRAQDLFFQGLVPLARRHYLSLPRYGSDRSRFGEPDVLPQMLESAGFKVDLLTEMVTGGHRKDLSVLLEKCSRDQALEVIDTRTDVGICELRSPEYLMEAIQPVGGQGGEADEHPHRPRENYQAGGKAVVF